jgi:paraquat-inducible protein A
LLLSVQFNIAASPLFRARLYRLVEFIGKWSMLDIYVVALLASLVHFQQLADITVGSGAIAFGAVVVLTLFAASAFDPRLIWDRTGTSAPGDT